MSKGQLKAEQNAQRNLRESEQGFKQLALTREEEARVRHEAEADVRDELRHARTADHYGEAQRLQAELETAKEAEQEQRKRADELAAGRAEMQRQLDAATAALAERDAALTAARTDAADGERAQHGADGELLFRNKLLMRQKQSLEAELNEAQRGVAPLRQRLKESDERCAELEAEIGRRQSLDEWYRAGMHEAAQRNESLLRGVNNAQLARRRSEARLAASRHEAQQTAQQLQRHRGKEHQAASGVAAMARRVAEVEASFGGLLLVSPPGQPAGSGRLPGGCITAAPRSAAFASASAASAGSLGSPPRTAAATQPSGRPRTAGTAGMMLGVTLRTLATPRGSAAAFGGGCCGGSSPHHSQQLPPQHEPAQGGAQAAQPAQQRIEAHSSGFMFQPMSAKLRDAAAEWAGAALHK